MRSTSFVAVALFGSALVVCAAAGACGSNASTGPGSSSSSSSSGGGDTDGSSSGSSGGSGGSGSGSGGIIGGSSGSGGSSGGQPQGDGGGVACPTGLQCNVTCGDGGTTSITGTVYDPAGKNPIYNVAVYVPAVPLVALPKGVPTGEAACNCGALYQSGALTNTTTAIDGSFTLTNVPVGSNVPLVIQVGKWRRQFPINVTSCTNNAQKDKTILLPSSVPSGDVTTNMPDIAVSTGAADTLECLMRRMGLPKTEYVGGNAAGGHVHIFSGGHSDIIDNNNPEPNGFPGAPDSPTYLWKNPSLMMPYDIVLLSCEGGETYDANPAALEAYLNAGGRAFASHFHYSWFSGPKVNKITNSYSAPSDWSNLASWGVDNAQIETDGQIGGVIDQTLNGSTTPFRRGCI